MPDSPSPLIRVHELSVTHDGNASPAPATVTFDVHAGEVILVLGPSGSGKSTLALTLNGLIPHDIPAELSGAVTIAGITGADATPAVLSPHVAMVFQDPDAQQVTGSLIDEVAFGPENMRLPVDAVLQRVEWALRRVGLWQRRHQNPDELSGGGRQRLAIACALAMGAPAMVLDEPTANLDPAGVEEVYATLAEIVADGDRAVVLVEHNLDEAIGFATRVIALDARGTVAFDGPIDVVFREHAQELADLGVWLPTATLAGLRLRRGGIEVPVLPLTPAELRAVLPAPAGATTRRPIPHPADDVIVVDALTVRRGGAEVLRDVSLRVPRGSFTAVVGGNGTGKTTLVQSIAGVLRPPKGTVQVDGLDPARVPPRRLSERIGFVFQNPEHQFIAATVADELAFGLRQQKLPGEVISARVDDMLTRFGLADRADLHPFLLSGGQKRRLSVGTALTTAAGVLALDEPTFGQDRARAAELVALLRDLNARGTTIVIVTHDMQLVADLATHVVVLANGGVHASGTPREVFADEAEVHALGLRMPPLPRAVRAVAGYEDVWDAHDFDVVAGVRA